MSELLQWNKLWKIQIMEYSTVLKKKEVNYKFWPDDLQNRFKKQIQNKKHGIVVFWCGYIHIHKPTSISVNFFFNIYNENGYIIWVVVWTERGKVTLMCYKVIVSKDWDQGEPAKERTCITFVIKNKCVCLSVSSQSGGGEGSFQVETSKEHKKYMVYLVISEWIFASIPGPAHSLPFHMSEEASIPQSSSSVSHKPHQDFALRCFPHPKGPSTPSPPLYL